MAYFPMMVNIENRDVLVIGGGNEGEKKVEVLNEFGAKITLVAPDASEKAISLSRDFYKRSFCDSDVTEKEYALIVAATDDREINEKAHDLALIHKIPVNVVDNIELCTFIFPAIIKERNVVIATSSSGKSPYVVQYLKKLIRETIPENIGEINDQMGEYRSLVKSNVADISERRKLLRIKFEELLKESSRK